MTDRKKSTKAALDRFYQKQLEPEKAHIPRQNEKPEKELVEKPCIEWLKANGFRHKITEAKGVKNAHTGKWQSGRVKKGTLDCQVTTPDGFSGWIEFKAPGKLKTIWGNPDQIKTLIEEISFGCFACVVDSVESLRDIYQGWIMLKKQYMPEEAKSFLMNMIPSEPKRRDADKELFAE